eukprot:CAMPEP_0196814052 /NCGR_PEP_ID=MMETSP1362-20130617/41025_1 /TAXON_ID=163516 /ORGANISM="Leptocylindrus danicus, Strain CCMP1856" /LENGTH=285 /DNA_ID=CAMNT_0042190553 /DNA_START=56 /DNA_END=913 /DNA_ORIENTATION=+
MANRFTAALLSSLLALVAASPAMVWNKSSSKMTENRYISEKIPASKLISEASLAEDSNGLSLVFVVQRAKDGSDGLSALAREGALPLTQNAMGATVYTHVEGLEGPRAALRHASLTDKAAITELPMLAGKVSNNIAASKKKSNRALREAKTVIISIDDSVDAADLDAAIAKYITDENVSSVILTGARSALETKIAKKMEKKARRTQRKAPRRRLEQEDGDENENDDGGDADQAGVYYVNMTPNILAGLLFFSFFTFVTFLGISCMGMIQGQDVYVTKMPVVGREA